MDNTVVVFLRQKRQTEGISEREQAKRTKVSLEALRMLAKGRELSMPIAKRVYRAYPDSLPAIIAYITAPEDAEKKTKGDK